MKDAVSFFFRLVLALRNFSSKMRFIKLAKSQSWLGTTWTRDRYHNAINFGKILRKTNVRAIWSTAQGIQLNKQKKLKKPAPLFLLTILATTYNIFIMLSNDGIKNDSHANAMTQTLSPTNKVTFDEITDQSATPIRVM